MNRIHVVAMVLLAFSYSITTVWLLRFGIATGPANALIKSIIASLFISSILLSVSKNARRAPIPLAIVAFFAIYSVRILFDVLVLGIMLEYQSLIYVYGYYFGLTILPMIAIIMLSRPDDIEMIHKWSFFALVVANLSLLFHALSSGTVSADTAFAGRTQVGGEIEGSTILNPIIFSLMGSILNAFVLGRLATGIVVGLRSQIFHVGLLALGVVNILFGGSRGPAIGFILCIFVTLYTLSRKSASVQASKTQSTAWLAIGGLGAGLALLSLTNVIPIYLFDRFASTIEERTSGGVEERDFLFEQAWLDFLDAPFIGKSYVLSVNGHLPHNIFLEALMSTGIVGGIFFFWAFFRTAQCIWRLVNGCVGPYGYSIALTAICFITLGFTSYSICQSPELWLFVTLVLVFGSMSRPQVNRSRQAANLVRYQPLRAGR